MPQNSCRPTHPLDLLLRGVERAGARFRRKSSTDPPFEIDPPGAFWERGRGPTTPSGNACHEVLHVQTLIIMYILYVYIQLYTYLTGRRQ